MHSKNGSESSDDCENNDSSSSSGEEEETTTDSDTSKIKDLDEHLIPSMQATSISITESNEGNTNFFLIPDNYFTMRSNKQKSSNNAFSKFMDSENDIEENNSKQRSIEKNFISLYKKTYFDKWMYMLTNFNIILYGVGSKYSIMQEFLNEKLQNYPCIVINGLDPELQLRNILKTILIATLDLKCSIPTNMSGSIQLIHELLEENNLDLFFVIHNIDGPVLRKSKCQSFFADLADSKNIHIIASVDHINASLLWDNDKMNHLKFCWWNVPTYAPYSSETIVTSQESEICHISYLNSIYKSLTKNLKEIFKVIINYQLLNEKKDKYEGLLFEKLLTLCQEQFLVSSDYTLHNYLKEFLDQKIIKVKISKDGSERFIVPFESSILTQILDQQNE